MNYPYLTCRFFNPAFIGIGYQNYQEIIENGVFYIDKTLFLKEWWESLDKVTLIIRPRRFGKTLNLSMVEQFFSLHYKGWDDLFQNMNIWKEEKYRQIQGTCPVISLSFSNVKENTYERSKIRLCQILSDLYNKHEFIKDSNILTKKR